MGQCLRAALALAELCQGSRCRAGGWTPCAGLQDTLKSPTGSVGAVVGGWAPGVMGTGHGCTNQHLRTCSPLLSSPSSPHFPALLPGDHLDPGPWFFSWTPPLVFAGLGGSGVKVASVPSLSPFPEHSLSCKAGIHLYIPRQGSKHSATGWCYLAPWDKKPSHQWQMFLSCLPRWEPEGQPPQGGVWL